jgi:hypothetical protein
MKVNRSFQALFLVLAVAGIIAAALGAYASRAEPITHAVAVQPTGMSVPF